MTEEGTTRLRTAVFRDFQPNISVQIVLRCSHSHYDHDKVDENMERMLLKDFKKRNLRGMQKYLLLLKNLNMQK